MASAQTPVLRITGKTQHQRYRIRTRERVKTETKSKSNGVQCSKFVFLFRALLCWNMVDEMQLVCNVRFVFIILI